MKKYLNKSIAVSVLLAFIASSNISFAYDEADCSIWLCLPVGFSASGCGAGKAIAMKRLKKGKNPLPSWGKCTVGNERQPYTSTISKILRMKTESGVSETPKRNIYSNNSTEGGYVYHKNGTVTQTVSKKEWNGTRYTEYLVGLYSFGHQVSLKSDTPELNGYTWRDTEKGLDYDEMVSTPFKKKVLRSWYVKNPSSWDR